MVKILCVILLSIVFSCPMVVGQGKKVAITLDDLLVEGASGYKLEEIEAINRRLIGHLDKLGIPVIGFVNEESIHASGETERRTDILRAWAGRDHLTLGNHTFSHPSFYETRLEDFKSEVLKGEVITKKVLEEAGKSMRYFRFPFNSTGPDSVTKTSFENFLSEKGYTIAPMTIESSDYIFNALYKKARKEGDKDQMAKITREYLDHTDTLFTFFENMALETLGKPIPHIFLGHVNELHADVMPRMIEMLQNKGYTIISLDQAMQDPVYAQKDPYVGKWGFSWLHRWNTENRMHWLRKEPEPNAGLMAEFNTLK